ncbi:Bug family tripartite tricarboxylate transporter substrate binding protein [Bordetella genomosp. 12]|uniref:ABC transporter substrate-binding protein n=1 Tax=Bordetella genomosp. 12 TaxID=463035 RepID=A0A261VCJ3_9BORD|nr:tripartite tricarboxylate transporter substrate binding protein [Bordetella genomosp. 12]OZI71866.1 hypothetical protein CAL22_18965 [Bordetella genomosp. 12]
MRVKHVFPLLTALAATAMACLPAGASAAYPDRPIKLLVGYTPGGAADAAARSITPLMSELLGQSVVVEYKPGAGGAIAAEATMRAEPDGYTLHLIDSGAMVVLPHIRKTNFDPLKSFKPIGTAAAGGLVLAVHPSLPAKTLPEFIALLRKSPDQYSYATSGVGGGGHVAAEQFKIETGLGMQHVAYRGGGPAMADLMGGQISVGMSTLAPAIPQIKANKIRALGVTSLNRASALPDVPTIAEQGYPGFEALNWYALVGPAGLPDDIVAKLNQVLAQTLASQKVQDLLREQGLDAVPDSPAQLTERVRADLDKWGKVIKTADIKAE